MQNLKAAHQILAQINVHSGAFHMGFNWLQLAEPHRVVVELDVARCRRVQVHQLGPRVVAPHVQIVNKI